VLRGVGCGLARGCRVIGLPIFSHVLLLNSVKRYLGGAPLSFESHRWRLHETGQVSPRMCKPPRV
jgi:hypothetical protein